MLISSYALQVRNAFVYIRGEFDLPYRRLAAAVEEAYDAGYFGQRILGTDFACDIVVYRGAGSYVCGEASGSSRRSGSAAIRGTGRRAHVKGLYQRPTVINNVETLSTSPASSGTAPRPSEGRRAEVPGTQLVSISATSRSRASTRSSTATR